MKLSEAIEALCDATAADGRSQRTVEGYRRNLGYLVSFLGDMDVEAITIAEVRKYAASLRTRTDRYADNAYAPTQSGGLSAFTIATYLRSVKRLFNFLIEDGVLKTNPAHGLRLQSPKRREPKGINFDDFLRLLDATVGDAPIQVRDRALLLFMADTGARAGGVCHLRVEDIDLERMTARLVEKGEKQRVIPLSEVTCEALAAWIAARPAAKVDWLFVTIGTRSQAERLTETGLKEILRRLKKRSGVTGRVNPHSFRHAYAREYIRNGGDLASLSRLLGHSDPSVTARFYAVFADQELRHFHQQFSPIARLKVGVNGHKHDDGELTGS